MTKAVQVIPDHDQESYEALKADIQANGIHDPIERCAISAQILDGNTRLRITEELGLAAPDEVLVPGLETQAERDAYAIRRNFNRRQLTADQRKALRGTQRSLYAQLRQAGKTQQDCAALLGVSQPTLSRWEDIPNIQPNNRNTRSGGDRADVRRTLTEADEDEILARVAIGETQAALAKAFDVQQAAISKALERARAREFQARHLELGLPATVAGVEVRCGDARDHLPEDLADLAFFSPPYNVGIEYDEHDDNMDEDDWWELLHQAFDVLRDGWQVGRVVVNLPRAIDRNPYRPVEPPAPKGFALEAEIVWDKKNTGNRTSWGSWRRASAPAIRDRTERLYVYRSEHMLRGEADSLVTDPKDGKQVSPWLSGADFTDLTQDYWLVSPASASDVGHPAPFPIDLARRVLKLYGWPGCTVIDPFAGSGTTGLAAAELGTPALLIDRSEDYCRLALRRLLDMEAAR